MVRFMDDCSLDLGHWPLQYHKPYLHYKACKGLHWAVRFKLFYHLFVVLFLSSSQNCFHSLFASRDYVVLASNPWPTSRNAHSIDRLSWLDHSGFESWQVKRKLQFLHRKMSLASAIHALIGNQLSFVEVNNHLIDLLDVILEVVGWPSSDSNFTSFNTMAQPRFDIS